MTEALLRADESKMQYTTWCRELRDDLWSQIRDRVSGVTLNGPALDGDRLSNNLNVSIDGVQGEVALPSLDLGGVAASSGSACTTGNTEPSHVLLASDLSETLARSSLRFTVGRGNTPEEIDRAVEVLVGTVPRARMLSNIDV